MQKEKEKEKDSGTHPQCFDSVCCVVRLTGLKGFRVGYCSLYFHNLFVNIVVLMLALVPVMLVLSMMCAASHSTRPLPLNRCLMSVECDRWCRVCTHENIEERREKKNICENEKIRTSGKIEALNGICLVWGYNWNELGPISYCWFFPQVHGPWFVIWLFTYPFS